MNGERRRRFWSALGAVVERIPLVKRVVARVLNLPVFDFMEGGAGISAEELDGYPECEHNVSTYSTCASCPPDWTPAQRFHHNDSTLEVARLVREQVDAVIGEYLEVMGLEEHAYNCHRLKTPDDKPYWMCSDNCPSVQAREKLFPAGTGRTES